MNEKHSTLKIYLWNSLEREPFTSLAQTKGSSDIALRFLLSKNCNCSGLSLRGGDFPPKQSFCWAQDCFGAKPVLSLPKEPPLAVTLFQMAEQLLKTYDKPFDLLQKHSFRPKG
jgi:hypothetical protein